MSINTYDEQKFWEEMDILFPDIVKAIYFSGVLFSLMWLKYFPSITCNKCK